MNKNKKEPNCLECNDENDSCQECCPHDETDHGECLDCGKDISDDLCNRAHEYFEGDR